MPKLTLLMALIALSACGNAVNRGVAASENPASQNCKAHGGQVTIRATATGTRGYCTLPDGRTLDNWAYYHQTNP